MSAITGLTGSVTFAAGYAHNVTQWEIEDEAEILDTTAFQPADSYATYALGLKRWRGTYQCHVDSAAAVPGAGATGAAVFTAATGRQYSGAILVHQVRAAVSVDGTRRIAIISFTGNGALARA